MFCSQCGNANANNSNFCVNCGKSINQLQKPNKEMEVVPSQSEIDLAYYNANLKLQQQALNLQEQQLIEQQKQFASMAKCPRCGSTSLAGNKKGYGIGKGVIGGLAGVALTGGIGLIGLAAGNMGAKKVIVTCMKCRKKFKA